MEHIKCQNCGWCCESIPCPVAIRVNGKFQGKCEFLAYSCEKSYCTLLSNEKDQVKKSAMMKEMAINQGCTHIFGPHPRALLKLAQLSGLEKGSSQWEEVKRSLHDYLTELIKDKSPYQKDYVQKALEELKGL